jgi:anion-transporting  ArsA/GET3 family ATPase
VSAAFAPFDRRLVVLVGAGGVGKTTLAAALALQSAKQGTDTLVMTFDPSLRLKDALGLNPSEAQAARDAPVGVPGAGPAKLDAALLDAQTTFDRIVARHAPDPETRDRIYANPFYARLAGSLAGILEYMAMERLFEVQEAGGYGRIVLDTPPTRQALDFLEAPDRIIRFLDARPVKAAAKPWWEKQDRTFLMRMAARSVEAYADRLIGRGFLMDLVAFIRDFAPLFDGFRERAEAVRTLLRSPDTLFVLVAGAGEDRIPDAMFFLRRLKEAGHPLGPVLVNQVHPEVPKAAGAEGSGIALLRHLGARDARGLAQFRARLASGPPVADLPLLGAPPSDLQALEDLGALVLDRAQARAGG